MTPTQKRNYILLPMLVLGVVALIVLAILRGIYGINLGTWQYVIVPFWIGLFAVAYAANKKSA